MAGSQAGLNRQATGQTSGDAQLGGLPSATQGAAEQEVAVQLQPMQLLGHRRRAADAPGRQGPFRIRVADAASIGLALFSEAMAPEQQFALNQSQVAPERALWHRNRDRCRAPS